MQDSKKIYIYESADGVHYAREFGSDPLTREIIGYDPDSRFHPDRLQENLENKLWISIRDKAKHNVALKDALDRCIEIYNLIKDE